MIDESDIGLMCHELGHALSQADEGAALVVIRRDGETGAMSIGMTIERSGLETMESTVPTVVAGPAFSVMLDKRLDNVEPAVKLKAGAAMVLLCATLGIAEHDLEELKDLGAFREAETEIIATHAAHMQMRRWMMIAMARAPAWRVLAEHIAEEVDAKGACGLPGANLRAMLDQTHFYDQMASIPGMFVTEDSLAQIVKDVPSLCPEITADKILPLLSAPVTTGPTGGEMVLLN